MFASRLATALRFGINLKTPKLSKQEVAGDTQTHEWSQRLQHGGVLVFVLVTRERGQSGRKPGGGQTDSQTPPPHPPPPPLECEAQSGGVACGLPLKTTGGEAAARQRAESGAAGASGRPSALPSSCLDCVLTRLTGRRAFHHSTRQPTGTQWDSLGTTGIRWEPLGLARTHWDSLGLAVTH